MTMPTLSALEVQRHAARAVLELDHLAGLDLVEAVGARDAVADAEHLADLGHFGLGAEIGDLALENGRNFCGADVHQPTSFMARRMALSLVLSEPSTMREPSLTMRPPMIEGSTLTSRSTSLPPEAALSCSFSAARFSSRQRGGAGDLGAGDAAARVIELAVVRDHVAEVEQAALDGQQADEIGGDPADALPVEDRVQRLELVAGGEDRAADESLEFGAFGDQRVELREGLGDGVGLTVVLGEREQRGRVAAGDSGNQCVVLCQAGQPQKASKACRDAVEHRQPPEFVMIPLREDGARGPVRPQRRRVA